MKKLFVVRHGEYRRAFLSDDGKKQIGLLSEKIVSFVNGDSVRVLSSTAPRAMQSAEIIATALGVEVDQFDILWSGGDGKACGGREDCQEVLKILTDPSHNEDVVIVVTHYEYVEDFPGFFAKIILSANLMADVIPKGTAWMLDCQAKTLVHIAP